MGRILILFHSNTGCVKAMAAHVAEGAQKIPGMDVRVRDCEAATAEDVVWCDGLAVGTPTNLGGIAWRMKKWWDDFAATHWDKIDGKLATVFSSQGGHGGGAELACQAMATVLLNFGLLTFGVTDYVSKLHTLHYGACVAKKPRNEVDKQVCRRLGLRLAEWVAYFVDGRAALHPLLTTKAAPEVPGSAPMREPVKTYGDDAGAATSTPVYLTVVKTVAPEKQAEWLGMAEQLAKATWRERGCLQYTFTKSTSTPNRFIIVERWASQDCLDDHVATSHFKDLVPKMDAISETVSLDLAKDALASRADLPQPQALAAKPRKKVLIFTKATDYKHESLAAATAFFLQLCLRHGFEPTVSDDSALLEEAAEAGGGGEAGEGEAGATARKEFAAVVFVNNSGQLFDPARSVLMKRHIAAGRGVLGVHACLASFLGGEDATGATKLLPTCSAMSDVFGTHFTNHPPPQRGVINVHQAAAAGVKCGLETLPPSFEHTDEFFNFTVNPADVEGVEVLASVDEASYDGGAMGAAHPVVWRRELGPNNARVFYSALGHFSHTYSAGNDARATTGDRYVARVLEAGLLHVLQTVDP